MYYIDMDSYINNINYAIPVHTNEDISLISI